MGEPGKIEGGAFALANFPKFEVEAEFTIFQELFENQLEVCGVANENKAGLLIASISTATYKVLKNLCDPELPKNKTYDTLIELLRSHFVKRISIFKERRHFYHAAQGKKETVNNWYLRLKGLAVNCAFGNELTSIFKDRFVSGLLSGPVFDRIAEEEPASISFEEVIKIAIAKDDYIRQNNPQPQPKEANDTQAPKEPRRKREPKQWKEQKPNLGSAPPNYAMSALNLGQNANKISPLCRSCGKPNHNFAMCPYKKFQCNNCQQIGHVVSMCRAPQKN